MKERVFLNWEMWKTSEIDAVIRVIVIDSLKELFGLKFINEEKEPRYA